jgi:hypothetical protein
MAHYAYLDKDGIVVDIITGVDETELIDGLHPEIWYADFRGQPCKRTSFNTQAGQHASGGTPFRGNYAHIGFIYDATFDAFYPQQPYPSWKLNYLTFTWHAPVAKPEEVEGHTWKWSEPNQEWVSVLFPETE